MIDLDRIQELAENIRLRRRLEQSPVFLIGAGCSASAKIPTADDTVEYVRTKMPATFKASRRPAYADCMSAMLDGVRRDLIAHFVQSAELNAAHLAIAGMVLNGMVDSILTTNFDPLLKVACNRVGARTVSLDLTLPWQVLPQGTTETPIYFLHGRHTGRVLLITEENFNKHSLRMKRNTGHLFRNAGRRGPWVICGYSGRNDPLLDLILQTKHYEYGLYWVLHPEDTLPDRVQGLRGLRVIEGHDADSFFTALERELGLSTTPSMARGMEKLKHLKRQ